jgi:hypothetical protein
MNVQVSSSAERTARSELKIGIIRGSTRPGRSGKAVADAEEYRNEILASVRSNRLGVPEGLAAMGAGSAVFAVASASCTRR